MGIKMNKIMNIIIITTKYFTFYIPEHGNKK
jgi:hypothetical protein